MFEITSVAATTSAESYAPEKGADNRKTENIVEKFIGALSELESARDVELMVALFAENCEVSNAIVSKNFRGLEGARRFWISYRSAFKDVCSIFLNEIYTGNEAKLEWRTEGKNVSGRKIKYKGVSILETEGGKIKHFYAYFDKQHLQNQISDPR